MQYQIMTRTGRPFGTPINSGERLRAMIGPQTELIMLKLGFRIALIPERPRLWSAEPTVVDPSVIERVDFQV